MYLVSCAPPAGPLEEAPRSALLPDDATSFHEPFWSTDGDAYYVRCTTAEGTQHWLELRDEGPGPSRPARRAGGPLPDEVMADDAADATPPPRAGRALVMVGRAVGARQLLIGGTRPRARGTGLNGERGRR